MLENLSTTPMRVCELHTKYIEGTDDEEEILIITVLLCNATFAVKRGVPLLSQKIYICSRSLKHIYDKHRNQSYDEIKESLGKIVKYPDAVLLNGENKRGKYIFKKEVNNQLFCVILEENEEEQCYEVVTAFPTKNENYLKKYQEIWSWRNGESSS